MKLRMLVIVVVAAMAAGCAVPSWVPFLGKDKDPAPPAKATARAPAGKGAKAGGKGTPRTVVADDAEDESATVKVPPGAMPRPAVDDDSITDRVVAVVNNDAITLGELQESVAAFRQDNRGRAPGNDGQLERDFLNRLIDTRLQLQEADREKIVVEEAEVTEELQARMKRFGASTMEELEAGIKAQGLTMSAVRRRVRESLRIAKVVRRKVTLRVSVTDQEIDRYIAENREKLEAGLSYHARHILIVPETDADAAWEAARIRAEMIGKNVREGADFGELARQYSRDASARDGGDLGVMHRGELAQDIEAQILGLAPGQVSAPYRSSLGYHVFKLEAKDGLEGESLQRARQQVRDILFREKYDARLAVWLREIKDRAIIEVRM